MQSRLTIEKYGARLRTVDELASIDRIFFESSGTKSFASQTVRAEFRERWLGRYLTHDAEWVYLAIAGDGEIAGYLVGCLKDPAQAARFDDIGYFKSFAALTAQYPAQLHVNLAGRWRGQGVGGDLVEAFVRDAAKAGAPGVHVVTGRGLRNVGFYNTHNFVEVGHLDWKGGEIVFLGRRLG